MPLPRSSRPGLLARLRGRRPVEEVAEAPAEPEPEPRPVKAARPDPQAQLLLDQLTAEAQYHRDRFALARARVIGGSGGGPEPGRMRELERMATAADERLAHARRAARDAG